MYIKSSFTALLAAICLGFGYTTPLSASPGEKVISAARYGIVASQVYQPSTALANSVKLNSLLKQYGGSNYTVELPEGTTWIAAVIHIPSRTTLRGHNVGSSIAIAPRFADAEEGFIENENYYLGNYKKDSLIRLEDFTILGNRVIPLKGQGRGVFFNKVSNVVINKLVVLDTYVEGIRIDCSAPGAPSENVLIENCRIERRGLELQNIMIRSFADDAYNNTRLASNICNLTIRNNVTIGGVHGMAIFNSRDVFIYGNYCLANSARGIIASPTSSNILIRKNVVDSAGSTGIHLAFDATNVIIDSNIANNTIADMSGIGQEGQGIKAYAGFYNVAITNNICRNNATDGIALEGGGASKGFLIKGNISTGNRRNGIRIWAGEINQKKSGNITDGLVTQNFLADNREASVDVGSDNRGKGKVTDVVFKNNMIKSPPEKTRYKVKYARKIKID